VYPSGVQGHAVPPHARHCLHLHPRLVHPPALSPPLPCRTLICLNLICRLNLCGWSSSGSTARICISGVQDQSPRFEPEWITRTLPSMQTFPSSRGRASPLPPANPPAALRRGGARGGGGSDRGHSSMLQCHVCCSVVSAVQLFASPPPPPTHPPNPPKRVRRGAHVPFTIVRQCLRAHTYNEGACRQVASLNRSWRSKEGAFGSPGMTGIEPYCPSKRTGPRFRLSQIR
jgi:hypothetical protein